MNDSREARGPAPAGDYGMGDGKPPRAPAALEIGYPVLVRLADGNRYAGIFIASRRPRPGDDYRERAEHRVELLIAMKDPFDFKNALVCRWFPITQCKPIDIRDL